MKFAPDDEDYDDATAHYRVIVGYDEEDGVVYFLDPWNRDLKKETSPDGTVTWSMADFENAWNYTGEYGTSLPYWGAVMMPWTVAIHTTGEKTAGSVLEVTAEITYPCPQPFDCSVYYMFNAIAEITLLQKCPYWKAHLALILDICRLEKVLRLHGWSNLMKMALVPQSA